MKVSTTSQRLKELMDERNLKQVDIIRMCEPYSEKYEGEEYDDLKEAWDLLYNELVSLYGEFSENPPKIGTPSKWLDFKTVDKYIRSYAKECSYFG